MDWAVNNQFLALGSMDKTVKILYTRVEDDGLFIDDQITLEGHDGTVRTVCTTVEDNPRVISAGQDQWLKIWDANEGRLASQIKGQHTHVRCSHDRYTRQSLYWTTLRFLQLELISLSSSSISDHPELLTNLIWAILLQ